MSRKKKSTGASAPVSITAVKSELGIPQLGIVDTITASKVRADKVKAEPKSKPEPKVSETVLIYRDLNKKYRELQAEASTDVSQERIKEIHAELAELEPKLATFRPKSNKLPDAEAQIKNTITKPSMISFPKRAPSVSTEYTYSDELKKKIMLPTAQLVGPINDWFHKNPGKSMIADELYDIMHKQKIGVIYWNFAKDAPKEVVDENIKQEQPKQTLPKHEPPKTIVQPVDYVEEVIAKKPTKKKALKVNANLKAQEPPTKTYDAIKAAALEGIEDDTEEQSTATKL